MVPRLCGFPKVVAGERGMRNKHLLLVLDTFEQVVEVAPLPARAR
jgi:hypothetical protein